MGTVFRIPVAQVLVIIIFISLDPFFAQIAHFMDVSGRAPDRTSSTRFKVLVSAPSTRSTSNTVVLRSEHSSPRVTGSGPPSGCFQPTKFTAHGPPPVKSTSWSPEAIASRAQASEVILLARLSTGAQFGITTPIS